MMKVKDLIEILKAADQDAIVVFEDCEGLIPAQDASESIIEDQLQIHWAEECQEALSAGMKVFSIS